MNSEILEQETLSHKLISKGFWAYFFVIFTAPIGYFIRLLASNTLSVSDIGIFYGVLSLFVLLSCYNDLGLTESMQYFLPKYWIEGKKGQIKNTILISFFMQFTTGIIIFLLLFFNAEWLAIHHFHEITATAPIKIMSLYFLGTNLIQICSSIFTAFQDTLSCGLVGFSNMFSVLMFSIIFRVGVGFNISLFALSWIIGVAVGIGVGLIQIFRKYKDLLNLKREKIETHIISSQFKYAFWVFLTANVGTLLGNVDQQLVVNKLGAESSGYFTNMLSLLNIFISIVSPLLGLLFPIATELSTRKEKDKFKFLESTMYTHFAFLAVVVGGLFLVFGQEIAVLLYGEDFRFSGELLQILGPCLIFNCLSSLNFYLLAGLGKIKERFIILLISLIINVTCNVLALFVFNLDLHAVIVVLALSRFIQFIGGLLYLRINHPFDFDRKFFFKNIIIISMLCLLFQLMKNVSGSFIFDKTRRELLFILAGICTFYFIIIAGFNRSKLKLLWDEVKKFRKGE